MNDTAAVSFHDIVKGCERALNTKRLTFYPNKDYGSKIYLSALDKGELLSFARQALDGFDGVYVKSVSLDGGRAAFRILINNREVEVGVTL